MSNRARSSPSVRHDAARATELTARDQNCATDSPRRTEGSADIAKSSTPDVKIPPDLRLIRWRKEHDNLKNVSGAAPRFRRGFLSEPGPRQFFLRADRHRHSDFGQRH